MKENNKKVGKLKKFVKDHEGTFVIAGCAIGVIAGAGLIYLGFRAPKNPTDIAFEKNMNTLFNLSKYVDAGTRSTEVFAPADGDTVKTVAEFFGDKVDVFLEQCPHVQPDDTIANFILNIAKKAET